MRLILPPTLTALARAMTGVMVAGKLYRNQRWSLAWRVMIAVTVCYMLALALPLANLNVGTPLILYDRFGLPNEGLLLDVCLVESTFKRTVIVQILHDTYQTTYQGVPQLTMTDLDPRLVNFGLLRSEASRLSAMVKDRQFGVHRILGTGAGWPLVNGISYKPASQLYVGPHSIHPAYSTVGDYPPSSSVLRVTLPTRGGPLPLDVPTVPSGMFWFVVLTACLMAEFAIFIKRWIICSIRVWSRKCLRCAHPVLPEGKVCVECGYDYSDPRWRRLYSSSAGARL